MPLYWLGKFTFSAFGESDGDNQTMKGVDQTANQTEKAIQGNAREVWANYSEGTKSLLTDITEGSNCSYEISNKGNNI